MLSYMQHRLRIEVSDKGLISQDDLVYPSYGTYEDLCYYELFNPCNDTQCVLNTINNFERE
jgi:hypothetical protein